VTDQPRNFFSIVIPTYNRASLIPHTIESVRKQSYKHYEIIVVDNCSTDNTAEVLRPLYEAGIITFIQNDKNYERAHSRNVGFKNAKGDYVTLLDSDDILYPECLADANTYINDHPGARFFHCLYDLVNDEYKTVRRLQFPPVKNPYKALMEGNFISNIGVFYRKELVEKVQFDENRILTGVEDYDFVIRVLAETRLLGRIDKVNAGILLHPNRSVNFEQWDVTYARIQYFMNKQLGSPAFMDCYGPYAPVFVANLQLYLSNFSAVRGRSARAFGFLAKAAGADFSIIFRRKFWLYFLIIIKYIFK
jgi:glycosyltransferase involved in cell wall biosynthesis